MRSDRVVTQHCCAISDLTRSARASPHGIGTTPLHAGRERPSPCAVSRAVRIFVVLLAITSTLVLSTVLRGPSGTTLRVADDVPGSEINAGDFVASINGASRIRSAFHATRLMANYRRLGRPLRLVCVRAPSWHNPGTDSTAVRAQRRPPPSLSVSTKTDAHVSTLPGSAPLASVSFRLAPDRSHSAVATIPDVTTDSGAPSQPPFLARAAAVAPVPDAASEAVARATPVADDDAEGLLRRLRDSNALRGALASRSTFEICAGRGTLSDAHEQHSFSPTIFSETDQYDQRYLRSRFRTATVVGDFFHRQWQRAKGAVLVVFGGISCVFVSPAGQQLAVNDERSPITTQALPWAASFFNAPFSTFENVPGIATADGGSVLSALDSNFHTVGYERVPQCSEFPSGLELARPNLSGAPGVRDRAIGHYEWSGLSKLIGPCPRLKMAHTRPFIIRDILDSGPRDPALVVNGRFTPVAPDLSNPRFPITAGHVAVGGPSVAIFVGSRVTCKHLNNVPWVVWRFLNNTTLLLFLDSRRHPDWYELDTSALAHHDPLRHLEWSERVLDVRGVANATTSFGVPFVGCAKQLWLVDGRVVSPSIAELWRIQEYDVAGIRAYVAANSGYLPEPRRTKLLRSMPGKGVSTRLSLAVASRTADRARLLGAVLDGSMPPYFSSFENALALSQQPFRPLASSVITFVVAVTWVNNIPHVLANTATGSLPAATAAAGELRSASIRHVNALFRSCRPTSTPPVSFLVDDFSWYRVVAVPLLHSPTQLGFETLAWSSLRELDDSPLRLPAYRALATIAALLGDDARPSFPPPALPGGARAPRFVPQAPPTLAVDDATWRAQLADGAAANGALRELLRSASDDDATYSHEWAEQIKDVAADAVPPNLRGAHADFTDEKFASVPFAYRDAIPTTVPAPVPLAQHSDYRPRNVTPDIFPVEVAERWALWWPAVLRDFLAYRSNPNARRTCNAPFVVAQSELHPRARGTYWDLRTRRPDGSFAPLDFSAPLDTHLNTNYLAEEWVDFPDQEMVFMLTVTGVDFRICHKPGQTVIYPHLESLPAGYASVESELRRLSNLNFNAFFTSFPFLP